MTRTRASKSAPPPRWRRARDGFVESHDGRWRITPCYAGCTRPQDYELWRDGRCVGSMLATQREAKDRARDIVERETASTPLSRGTSSTRRS